MYWQENQDDDQSKIPDDIQDLRFRINATTLPLDHAYTLSQALVNALPWLQDEPNAGIHLIHHSDSGYDWQNPDGGKDRVFHVSKRAHLTLRLPKHRISDAIKLTGRVLEIGNLAIGIGIASSKPLSAITTLIAHNIILNYDEAETDFIERIVHQLAKCSIPVRKILCGRRKTLQFAHSAIPVCSVLIADLSVAQSIKLQQIRFGEGRLFSCGIFIPHKGISTTNTAD